MNNSMKTPLIRLAKREGMDKRTGVGHPVWAPSCWRCCWAHWSSPSPV